MEQLVRYPCVEETALEAGIISKNRYSVIPVLRKQPLRVFIEALYQKPDNLKLVCYFCVEETALEAFIEVLSDIPEQLVCHSCVEETALEAFY